MEGVREKQSWWVLKENVPFLAVRNNWFVTGPECYNRREMRMAKLTLMNMFQASSRKGEVQIMLCLARDRDKRRWDEVDSDKASRTDHRKVG